MSGERMTSRSDQELMKQLFDSTIRELESYGFDRSQIGAAMVGIGFGIFAAHRGHARSNALLDAQRNILDREFTAKH